MWEGRKEEGMDEVGYKAENMWEGRCMGRWEGSRRAAPVTEESSHSQTRVRGAGGAWQYPATGELR